jgi:hypothetical protein
MRRLRRESRVPSERDGCPVRDVIQGYVRTNAPLRRSGARRLTVRDAIQQYLHGNPQVVHRPAFERRRLAYVSV